MKINKLVKIVGESLYFEEEYSYPSSSYLESISSNEIKLLITARNNQNISRLLPLTYNLKKNKFKLSEPRIGLGKEGEFDHTGTSYPVLFLKEKEKYLFYTGWSKHQVNPFKNSLGLLFKEKEEEKKIKISIFSDEKCIDEIGSCDLKEFEESYFLFYTEFQSWQGKSPKYNIYVAKSENLMDWEKDNSFYLGPLRSIKSDLVCRPSVIESDSKFYMFFCHREADTDYKIGLLSSLNFFDWDLHSINIFKDFELEPWCRIGQCYPHITFDNTTNKFRLFFGGNSFGKGGFGYAEIDNLN